MSIGCVTLESDSEEKSEHFKAMSDVDGIYFDSLGFIGDKNSNKVDELIEILKENSGGKATHGVRDVQLEALYSVAYRYYQQEKYSDASDLFRYLILLNCHDPRSTNGMAASLHMMGAYGQAVAIYKISYSLDQKNPMPLFYAAKCLLKIGSIEEALECLAASKKVAKQSAHYGKLISEIDRLASMVGAREIAV